MARDPDTTAESQVSTDPETIQSWTAGEDLVPVRREGDDGGRPELVGESARTDAHEELSWSEFRRELRDRGLVVVRTGTDPSDIDVVARSEVAGRATVQHEAVEEALVEGETVETEIRERTVVEHVVVEEATVESEIVDREIVHSAITDVDLLSTTVEASTVSRARPPDESTAELTWFQPGTQLEDPYDVELDVTEDWQVTRDVVERLTIESRVVDTDVEETETVETDTLRETVDIEGVTETILEGELVESPETARAAVEEGHVESQFRSDDVIETHLLRRQTIDEELAVDKRIHGEVADAETESVDARSHTVLDSQIVGADEYDVDLAATVAAAESDEAATAEPGTEAAAGEMAGEPATGESEARVTPTEDDEGKTVVNPNGDEVGMVVDVENSQLYVDPHPSITDRIRTVLGWSDHGEDSYHLGTDHIDHIDDDQVVLRVEHER